MNNKNEIKCEGQECPLCKAGIKRTVQVPIYEFLTGKVYMIKMPEEQYNIFAQMREGKTA